jgi:RND superfamily putative drug exporter
MFSFLSRTVTTRPWLVILLWIVLVAIIHFTAPRWDTVSKDDNVRFFPQGSASVIGQELLERGFPKDAASSQVVLVYERRDAHFKPEDFTAVENAAKRFFDFCQANPELGFKKLDTHRSPVIGPRLIAAGKPGSPGQAVLTIISLNGTYLSKTTRIAVDRICDWLEQERPNLPVGLERYITGSAVVGHDMNTATNDSLQKTTWATVLLVVLILLLVYRSPLLAMIPLVTIAISVFGSLRLIVLLTEIPALGFQVINITRVFVIVVLFGAGTDYCLFLIARYTEELARGRNQLDALRQGIQQVGAALVASAGTVIVGLGMLYFSTFIKIRFTGPTIAICLAVALLASLTFAPALLALLKGAIFWPFQTPHHTAGRDPEAESLDSLPMNTFWIRVADLVVAHPLVILCICLIVLCPLAAVGARAQTNYSQLADLRPDRPSVIGSNVIKRYFAVGELSPAIVLIDDPKLSFRSPDGSTAIEQTTSRLQQIPNIAEVRSLTQPLGARAAQKSGSAFIDQLAARALKVGAESRYVSVSPANRADLDHITRFDLVFKTDPFSGESLQALEQARKALQDASAPGQPLDGTTAIGLAGSTAAVNDLRLVTSSDQRRMYVLVTMGVYIILVILIRRPVICLYLIATVVLGYLASLGVTDLVFRALHNRPEPWAGLDWTVAFFLFVILVAVGEDYNILLMARVIEEEAKHGLIEGTRRAVAHTGGIISSCGLIMAGTFGSMITGSLTSLRELGFALGLGVLLDTFLVRPILVPAFVILIARWKERQNPDQHPANSLISVTSPATNTTRI